MLDIKCVFLFSLQILFQTFSSPMNNGEKYAEKRLGLRVNKSLHMRDLDAK
jgi:hypothetical protein